MTSRCLWTGLPCDCNDVSAMVDCPHELKFESRPPKTEDIDGYALELQRHLDLCHKQMGD